MSDHITITGTVATDPKHIVTAEGMAITSFRFASTQRYYSRQAQAWVDGETNWYTVVAFRALAINAAASLNKGEHVIVSGRVRILDWSAGEKSGRVVEVEAEAIGHDLGWGISRFTRQRELTVPVEDDAPAPDTESADAPSEAVAA